MLSISLYEISYAKALVDIFRQSVHQTAIRNYNKAQCNAWAPEDIDLKIWHDQRSQQPTYVAIYHERPVGFIDMDEAGYINMLYVHPDFQKKGVASYLFAYIASVAKDNKISNLSVNASITALPIFQKWGFEIMHSQNVYRNGQYFTNYHLQKKYIF